MKTRDAMCALEAMGYSFRVDETGEIKFRSSAERTPEASALLAVARADRAAAADYVRQREAVTDDGCTYSVLDALAIAQAVKREDAFLLAPVVFHRDPVTVTVIWQPVHGVAEAVLDYHREKLINGLQRRLQALENKPLEQLSEQDVNEYDRCIAILEVCR